MRIAVLPASPKTGRATIKALLESDQLTTPLHVQGIYRDPSKAPAEFLSHPSFHAGQGDLSDANTLELGGVDMVLAITPPRYDASDILQWARVASENTRLAIQKAGTVKRVVLLSSTGAEQPSGTGEIMTNHIAEEILQHAAPEVIFMRCAYFMENWESAISTVRTDNPHFYSVITPLDYRVPMVAVDDIGRACATYLLGLEPPRSPYVVEVRGPQEYTVNEVQQALHDAVGQEVEIRPVKKEDFPDFFGRFLPQSSVGLFVEMTNSFLPGGVIASAIPNPDVRVYRGRMGLGECLGKISVPAR
ncbi:NAD(P)-binding protein [Aspergillus heteromorphus CBS 117.55]|uniref:NAD(P)-binding protein n=1 Tax=Aspergillus heteromorphus CBS 117.55 TaxID=1448321 RepID=A0A317UZM7_9EURO|nr:NAD(P)-binding protein [Aspergillus heteromorphus CBS 117.55]PWY66007.1 NAD(P)-binding protein [Aspergillus heteromorphus CBS 117.55]